MATERLSTGCLNAWFDGSARCVAIGEIVFGEQNLTSSEEVRFLIHQGEDPHPFLNGKDFRQKCILYDFLPSISSPTISKSHPEFMIMHGIHSTD